MKKVRKIELLAPAKNAEFGIEAINHGADAVYIGAPKFSARIAAGNSLEDIRKLINYAHQYGARVYVALNTILKDKELAETETLIRELYKMGADALIIQDMGILKLNLPPIPLHASTQTDNRSRDKIKFLEQAGFSRIILARELTSEEIINISSNCEISLESFIHGALCVSYSGQCYLSQAFAKRSANRGECAQLCRLPFTLTDADGKDIIKNKHVLSLKDLNLSENLEDLLLAGVDSLKIEGRLKDLVYVKNVVAYYRQKLDKIIDKYPYFIRASSGKSVYTFTPDPNKSFNRGYTEYFFIGRTSDIWSLDSPKSIGEPIGKIKDVFDNFFILSGTKNINNGDGLCFLNNKGELQGMRVNRVEGEKIFPYENHILLKKGIFIFRNYDHEFEKILSKKSAERKIEAKISLRESESGYYIIIEDEDGITAELNIDCQKESAKKNQDEVIINNFKKTGDTIFKISDVNISFNKGRFIPVSVLSEWRRNIMNKLLDNRMNFHIIPQVHHTKSNHPYPQKNIYYSGNVMNKLSERFYIEHQSIVMEPAYEIKEQNGVPLMFTRHCIKYAMGWCHKNTQIRLPYKEPFFLLYKDMKIRIEFNCVNCEMKLYKEF